MLKILITVLLLFVSLSIYSQDSTKNNLNDKFIIKLAPLSYFDIIPSYQIAVEYKLYKYFSLQNEIGYITNYIYPRFKIKVNTLSGFRSRNELRFNFKTVENNQKIYLALEILYMKYNDNIDNEYNILEKYIQKVNVNRVHRIFAFHHKIGAKFYYEPNPRLIFDIYVGLGFRFIYQKSDYSNENSIALESTNDFDVNSVEGNNGFPSIVLGYKIGYIIK